jgi:glycosyltransferase involved in cell wall biosynthesis
LKWFWQKHLLQKTAGILTDSSASKEEIINITGISQDKIKVIYLGVNEEFKKIKDKNLLEKARKNMNLPDHFLLTVGDVNWNKNIPNLIRTFSLVNKKDNQLQLLLVGKGFVSESLELREIMKLIESFGLSDKVIRRSDLSLLDLVNVYNLADLFILTSFAEGFGLPLLEAYSCQCPALTTKAGSLQEIAGKSAIYIEPHDISNMAEIVKEILSNKEKKQEMITYGLKRVSEFSWKKCARETLEFYKQVST